MSDKDLIVTLQKQVSELMLQESALLQRVSRLEHENAELKAELAWYKANRNSHNSHPPPSRDIPKPTPPKRKRKKSSHNPGGQRGHKANRLEKVDSAHKVVI